MVNLCITLTISHLLCKLTKRLPNPFEQTTYFLAWLIATLVNTLQFTHLLWSEFSSLTVGLATMLSILFIAFLLLAIPKRTKTWIRI